MESYSITLLSFCLTLEFVEIDFECSFLKKIINKRVKSGMCLNYKAITNTRNNGQHCCYLR